MRSLLLPVVALVGVLAFGCSSSTKGSGASPDGGASATDGGAGAAGPRALTCSGILDCAGKCADDKTCEDACLAQGSPAAQESVNGLVACAEKNSCQDSACFQENCGSELQACVASSSATGETLTGSAPTGNVPADLVGRWIGDDNVFEFSADGTVTFYTEVKTGSCKTTSLEKGTAVAEGTNLTLYFTSRVYKVCDTPGTQPYTAKSVPYVFRVDPATATLMPILHLKEVNCRYSDPAAAEMFCSVGYDKQ
jgi:hypothetical protein